MARLARILTFGLALVVLTAIACIWAVMPYVERRWIFSPTKSASAKLWQVPEGAMEVSFATSDGVRLAGWFFSGVEPKTGITVLFLHGNQGLLPDYVKEAQFLRTRGFDVLMFNYRGFGKSEGMSRDETTLDLDGAAALRYLARERGVPANAIAFLGVSLGAAVAANLAATSPCRAVALLGAFSSSREQAKRIKPWIPLFVFDFLNSPLDTIGKIGRSNCPVMVVHGAEDDFSPLEQAQGIYDAAPTPKRLVVIPDAGHAIPDSVGQGYLGEMVSFFLAGK